MDFNDNKSSMDEFHWEREFRKDDERISSCMREIPAVVDLPGEDELLMKRVQKQPEHVRGVSGWNDPFREDFFDFEDISFPDNWRESEGAEVYICLERLMEHWCRIYAANSNESGMRIICHYGNIMGYAIDLVDFGGEKMPGLKIAIVKRIYNVLNKIISLIGEIKCNKVALKTHTDDLFNLRQKVLDLRFKLSREES